MIRIVIGLIVSLLLIGMIRAQQARLPAEVRLSRTLSGEHWYAIALSGDQVGYLHTTSGGTPEGGWIYTTHTHVLLAADEPLNITKSLQFGSSPPYPLIHGEQQTRRGEAPAQRTVFVSDGEGLLAQDAQGGILARLDDRFTLADFLFIEQWLSAGAPAIGSRVRAPTLLFDALKVRNTAYTLMARDAAGFLLQSEAPIGPTMTRLGRDLLPESIDVGSLFRFTSTDAAGALATSSPAFKSAYLLPVRSRLAAPDEITSMRLTAVDRDTGESFLSVEARRQWVSKPDPWSTPLSGSPHPAVLPILRDLGLPAPALAESVVMDRLLATVQDRLRYQEGASTDSLDAVLARGYGECTDFADVLTALAQAAGLHARTVIGLAYQDRTPYGFAFHAWNEVEVDGQWQVVDPTWNQRYADATHLPLDDRQLAILKMYGTRQTAWIEVTDIVRTSGGRPT